MIGEELGGGIIEGADIRPISRESRQTNIIKLFEAASAEIERTGKAPEAYDDLEDWFETQCQTFRSAKLPVPERPGFMRSDEWDIDRLVALADQLGRKLDVPDVTPGLRRFAAEWLRALPTPIDFSYLADMRYQIDPKGGKRPMSIGQAKGVLNCAVAAARRTPKVTNTAKAAPEPVELEAGIYFKDGTVYKVQRAVHGSGHAYAKRLVVEERYATAPVFGSVPQGIKGKFEYDKGAIRTLTPEHRMTMEQAKEFGAIYGVCCNCGATLTNEDSIERGIGPICAKGFA